MRSVIIQLSRIVSMALVAYLLPPNAGFAQETVTETKFGISASVQSEQFDLALPVRTGDRVVIVPSVGFVLASDNYADFAFGFALRLNSYHHNGKAVPYFGARVAALRFSPEGPAEGATDFIFGPLVGGEYFLDDHFSLGVEAQLNIAFSDDNSLRFGNPGGTNVNTATVVMATFYF